MKKYIFVMAIALFLTITSNAQEVKLDLDGALKVGDFTNPTPAEGTIRYNEGLKDFEGWNGTSWSSLTMGSSSATTVKDVDNNVYNTVTIGSQTWLVENLRTTRFSDSTAIAQVLDSLTWTTTTDPAYTWYDNGENNHPDYGALYNWFAVDTLSNENKNICLLVGMSHQSLKGMQLLPF